ncbi:transmembrane protein 101 isoform X2 [Prinia subflava]|uniref:transmembrane protein 101 isoform X2 n=1 Tax=Prinia subflava TaxID=208062 RepID=UPI002FE2A0D6
MAAGRGWRRRALRLLTAGGGVLLTRFPFWHCFSGLLLCAERADLRRQPDIPVPYLYVDMGAAVLCASFMSFGVKRRWFALGAALQLAVATYAAHVGGHVHYGDWLKVRMYSRTIAIIGGFLILASGAGELYRQKPRSRSLQSTGQVFLGIYLICQVPARGQRGDSPGWGHPCPAGAASGRRLQCPKSSLAGASGRDRSPGGQGRVSPQCHHAPTRSVPSGSGCPWGRSLG